LDSDYVVVPIDVGDWNLNISTAGQYVDLTTSGIPALVVPTRLSVRGALAATGTATADEPTQLLDIAVLGVGLPVYPDGPVTLLLPVRRAEGATGQVVVSYGACSSSTCLAPVIDEAIPISVP
jgi:hypothetical protein